MMKQRRMSGSSPLWIGLMCGAFAACAGGKIPEIDDRLADEIDATYNAGALARAASSAGVGGAVSSAAGRGNEGGGAAGRGGAANAGPTGGGAGGVAGTGVGGSAGAGAESNA